MISPLWTARLRRSRGVLGLSAGFLSLLMGPSGAVRAASAAETDIVFKEVSAEPASAKAGETVRVNFTMMNGSKNEWAANRYQVAIEFLTAGGESIQRTPPLPMRSPTPAGGSKTLHINKIKVPPDCPRNCSLRVLILESDAMIAASPSFALRIAPAPTATAEGSVGVEIGGVSMDPASAHAGDIVRVGFSLRNGSEEDWAANRYQVAIEFSSAAGDALQKSKPIPVRSALPAGNSKKFHINKTLPACSENCSLRVLVLEDDKVVAASQPLAFIASPTAP